MAYEDFFGFKEPPFRLTPDPDYYFPSDVHKKALQSLLYSIRAGEGFAQITGEPGTGKTLILRTLLKELGNEVNTALILNPKLTPQELLGTILEDLGIDPSRIQERSKEERFRYFREYLLEEANQGISTVIIIDEAQNLPNDTMEELRLLSNLETEKKKLLQIILVGQVELEKKLQSPELKQLDQRITIRYRMRPLSRINTIAYVNHRLQIAGGGSACFSPRVLGTVYKYSRGVPRLINIICERALMAAFVEGKNTIGKPQIKKAMESIEGEKELKTGWLPMRPATALLLGLFLIVAVIGGGYQFFGLSGWKASNSPAVQDLRIAKFIKISLVEKEAVLKKREEDLRQKKALLEKRHEDLSQEEILLSKREDGLTEKEVDLSKKEVSLKQEKAGLGQKVASLKEKEDSLREKEDKLKQKKAALEQKEASLKEKVDSLKEEDVSLKQKAALLDEKEATIRKKGGVLKKEFAVLPPPEVFHVPSESFFLCVDRQGKKAYLWQGGGSSPELKREFEWEWPFVEGLFVLGKDVHKKAFIFSHLSMFWGSPYLMADKLWEKVSDLVSGNLVPVLVYSSKREADTFTPGKAQDLTNIIRAWAGYWTSMDIKEYMNFYGDVFVIYYLTEDKPFVFTRDQFYKLKQDVFSKAGAISLSVSDPLCVLDPNNPKAALAIFYQKYNSQVYSDEGFKVIYFAFVEEPGAEGAWKMVAKLWLPLDSS